MTRLKPGCTTLGPDLYAEWRRSTIGEITDQLERRLILELIGDVTGKQVLDVGCGDGMLAVELAIRGAQVTGIDASETMIRAARERARREDADVPFEVAAAQRLPFPEARFDRVTAITILCFVDDATPVFREIARVLRPGGKLVIGELGRWSSWAAMRRIRAWLGSPVWRRGRFRSARELRSLAEQAGLQVEIVRGAIYYPRWRFAASLLAPCDAMLGRLGTFGAAFVAVSACKPPVIGKKNVA
jgi:ubiquinone biosynthesis O-methyltransferase